MSTNTDGLEGPITLDKSDREGNGGSFGSQALRQ
jgi:hypothetical protein